MRQKKPTCNCCHCDTSQSISILAVFYNISVFKQATTIILQFLQIKKQKQYYRIIIIINRIIKIDLDYYITY